MRGACGGVHRERGEAPVFSDAMVNLYSHDVLRLAEFYESVGFREVVVKDCDGRPRIERRPVRERESDILVVVQDSYSEAFRLGGHRAPTRPTGRLPSGKLGRVARHVQYRETENDSPAP